MFGTNNKINSLMLILGGFLIGLYFHDPIISFIHNIWVKNKPDATASCPSPELIVQNQDNPASFNANDRSWTIEYHGWKAPDKIGFMQAIIDKENNLICYYKWPNPKEEGSNLWMTVQLSPLVTEKISPYGSYWRKEGANEICRAGINACAYRLEHTH